MTPDEFIIEFNINCENDFEVFWTRNFSQIQDVDVSDIKIMAFHIAATLDNCNEIKTNGLQNLQKILSTKTILRKMLRDEGIEFDIKEKTVVCCGKRYDIDYEKYKGRHLLSDFEKGLQSVAHRVYYDYCVNGFLLNDNIYGYGTAIHERPEFLMTLQELFPHVQKIESEWKNKAKSYRIDFFAAINQVHRFNFELDEQRDPPYNDWIELDDEMKIKKWMLSHAIERANNNLYENYLYVKDEVSIPPSQIISITEL